MLRELQLGFVHHLFTENDTLLTAQVRANGLSGARRLQVYRNNTFMSLTEVLRAIYPVVERLVGEGFFRYAADRYIRRFPSVSGDLHQFGGHFSEFLKHFEPVEHLVYLADVANLEWAYHTVFHAAEHPPMDISALQGVLPAQYGSLRFYLHPSARLLLSDYPILRIWQVNQPDYVGDAGVDLGEGGIRLLLIRRHLEIELETLQAGEYALLAALAADLDFATACEQALKSQPDIDLPAVFRRHVSLNTVVNFSLR
jgi:hypothetical protein